MLGFYDVNALFRVVHGLNERTGLVKLRIITIAAIREGTTALDSQRGNESALWSELDIVIDGQRMLNS